jgi:CDP-glycerol glycerophosphotransferase
MKIIRNLIRYIFYFFFFPFWYLERLITRDKNLWVFGSLDGNGYGDNSRTFYEFIVMHHPEINAVWLTRNKKIYNLLCSKNNTVFMLRSFKGILYSLKAKYFITDHSNGDLNVYAGNGAVKIYLWHGMPLKTLGFYNEEQFKKKRFFLLIKKIEHFLCPYSRIDNIDLLIISSDFFKPFMASSFTNVFGKDFPLKKIVTTGLPRNDSLFKSSKNFLLNEFRRKYKNCRILLYMPTFRLGLFNKIPFSPFTGFNFNMSVFADFIEDENIVFLFKPHPYDTNLPDFTLSERFLYIKGNEYDDFYDFLGSIDILVTDYSSVYFDFILTDKPVILTPFDYDEYIKIRGLFFDYNEYMSAVKAYNWNDFMDIVRQKKYYSVDNVDIFNYYRDADSCKRVFDIIKERWH